MDLDQLIRRTEIGGAEFTILRPGITLCLFYAQPAATLAPVVADLVEEYRRFIPAGALQSYYSPAGTWKKANERAMRAVLDELRAARSGDYAEVHLAQEPLRSVGDYGMHFHASPLDDLNYPREVSVFYLEFPADLSTFTNKPDFIDFVRRVALATPFDSGYCGYAFKQLQVSFRREAFKEIAKLAMRFVGFDVGNDLVRFEARGRVCNVSWLTLFGADITAKLGGTDAIYRALPNVSAITPLDGGVLVQAADEPIVGDVNRGAADTAPLRALAALTRDLRLDVPNLGPDDADFAPRWLGRFDD
jgi:hypothetical protein